MDNLDSVISKAEQRWLKPITDHLQSVYNSAHLPSHDPSHHLRVWGYCKELLVYLDAHSVSLSFTAEQVLIASLFHDVGLTVDTGEFHGFQSKLLCEQFFNNNPHLSIEGLEGILYAIEHHDDKRFKGDTPRHKSISLVTLISTADDLDAYGLVGVFRYLEIYAIRGVEIENIPQKVLANLGNRFANFDQSFGFVPALLAKHQIRCSVTKDFFEEMHNDFANGMADVSDSINIAQTLISTLVKDQHDIKTAIVHGFSLGLSPKRINFFFGLKDELGL